MKSIKKLIKKPLRIIRDRVMDIRSAYYIKRNIRGKNTDVIRIGFIVQMAEVWDKEVRIYEELRTRADVKTFLIVVPPYDFKTDKNTLSYENDPFLSIYPEAIKALQPDGKWIDIKKFNLDYLFFQRPYDHYLPKPLRSTELVKHTKCCYVPYGYAGSDVFNRGNTNLPFFRNMSFVFLESEYMKGVFKRSFEHRMMFKYQKYETLGYPDLEVYFDNPSRDEISNILWTPRWSYDPEMGGSHYFEYKDLPFFIKSHYSDIDVVFRPHPLMFDEFIKQGLMKQQEADDYKRRIREASIAYDSGTLISEAISRSDLLITDYSSIIINYFLTGKPIIYCKADYELNEEYSKIESCLYVAEDQQQIEAYIAMLLNGEDPLAEKRKALIEKYRLQHIGAAKRIVDCLLSVSQQ